DAAVIGDFNTGNSGSNDKFVFMPLALAQSLYDAENAADRITVLLDDSGKTEIVRDRLLKKLNEAGFDVEIRTWRELSDFYNQVHRMFDTIFGFIFSIVLTVVVMSVANSMGMTVIERTREIGTLRSIGLKRGGVVRLFAMEALLLSAAGVLAGFALALLVRQGVNAAHFSYFPPGSSATVPLAVDLDPGKIAVAALTMLSVGTAAALFPAIRAAGKPIVEALGHV
ncbi:MAG: ABC transporter permease, partial [Burkholderiales bacterium]|nr:ABC transporter permease [Burkholderiales bacterium]